MSFSGGDVSDSDIAIIGMALRVPGARTPDEFWANLRGGVESIRDLCADELAAAGESPERMRRKNYVPRAADLPDMEMFDADFFGLGPKEAAIMDPQHRHFLECAWEAMEDACRPPESVDGPVGVFAGCGMGSYFYFNVCSHRGLVDETGMFLLRHTGNDKDFLATRASYTFDLRGPSVNVQTACSTSLVAVHYACQSLLSGECDMALAGGCTIELPHRRGYLYQDGEILSPDGHCRAFDHRAAGTVFGSGAGVVVLRRLADALADGDPVRAVIKATAVNNDGADKAGYLAPSVGGQAAAIVEALTIADIPADTIGYVECHGTGTYLGDPIEIEALTQAFRQSTQDLGFCRIGSVKTNIGHLDTAAGVVSLIKASLALEHGEIPPSLGYEKPNPAIPFASSPFIVNDRLTPWPETGGPRRAGVNSLGVGGTNAHAILQEAPKRMPVAKSETDGPQLLVLSARNAKALGQAGERLAARLETDPDLSLRDAALTLATGRRHFGVRRVAAVAGREDAIAVLREDAGRRLLTQTPIENLSGAVFLFPGGGAQYPGMGRTLYTQEPAFRATVDEGLGYLTGEAEDEIRRLWLSENGPEAAERLLVPSLQLPAILIVEVALARLLMNRGVRPAAMIGHSMGENAAACIANVLDFETAVKLVRLRGELFDEIAGGGMLSVGLSLGALKQRLPESLDIASVNAPELCVVSGSDDDLDAFRANLEADGIEASRIPISIAAHSRRLEPILPRFEAFLRKADLRAPDIPIVSNLTGTWLTDEEAADPLYWTRHLRSTVRFSDCLHAAAQRGAYVYIEAGPGRTLSSLAKAQGAIAANQTVNCLPHADEHTDDRLHFMTAIGRCWAADLPLDLENSIDAKSARRVPLPAYPFQHQRYFLERIAAPADAGEGERPEKIANMAEWGWRPVWKLSAPDVILGADRAPSSWLIFLGDTALGETIAARLRAAGHAVTTVAPGDAFARLQENTYTLCAEDGRPGYDELLQDLAANGGVPERILHLGLVTGEETFRPGSSFFHRNQERGFYSLFHLAQALADLDSEAAKIQITVLTNGMQRVGGEPLPYPEKATVLGPAQVIPREMPNVAVRVIDLPFDFGESRPRTLLRRGKQDADAEYAHLVWDDLFAAHGGEIAAYRDGRRWTRCHDALPLDGQEKGAALFREGGVYLITGGLGDLGLVFARDLAARFKARIVLIGRTELPEPAGWDAYIDAYGATDRIGKALAAIREIESCGGEVLYLRADVSDPEAMRSAVDEARARFGAVNGVLHAAGAVRDELIQLKDQAGIDEVFAPKLFGTDVLAEVLAGERLDFAVLFSSTSTDTAPAGQADYVAANAYLNAFAESRPFGPDVRTVAVHWGIWRDTGLAARALRQAEQGGAAAMAVSTSDSLFFDRLMRDGDGREWLEGRWDAKRHWILDEHRLASGQAVWPGTGYIEVIAHALAENRVDGPFEIVDLTFQRPLHIPDRETRIVRTVLTRQRGGRYALAMESERPGTDGEERTLHAEAAVQVHCAGAGEGLDIAALKQRLCDRVSEAGDGALPSPQEAHLHFGPRWKVLRSVHFGQGEALARLELPAPYASDPEGGVRLHPALFDIATGFAMELIPGYDAAAGLWVPISYGRIRVHAALPRAIWSHARLDAASDLGADYASFDIVIADEDGRALVEIESFTLRRLPPNADFAAALSGDTATPGRLDSTAKPYGQPQELSPALARLAAQMEQGIAPEEGPEALMRALGSGLPQVIVSSIPLPALQRAAARIETGAAPGVAFERPDLDTDFVGPRNDIEAKLAGFWSELLGVQKIGVHDSFFDLGGHSLIAVRLFRMIRKAYHADFPISVLFEAPTIAQCAELIARSGAGAAETDEGNHAQAEAAPRYTHLVRMNAGDGSGRTPFFICAGMFGNILNLRHLAMQAGQDRPVYGLQARGLYGGEAPHETFEEMARDYIREVRAVQPEGPYLLGGFSGGGLVAYEMAQQLTAAGETVAMLVMLDTPFPEDPRLSFRDRMTTRLQDMKREGAFTFLSRWVRWRLEWELNRRRRQPAVAASPDQFHSAEIEAAFLRALWRYAPQPYDGDTVLLRPKLRVVYRLSGGRQLNAGRVPIHADNGWTTYIGNLAVIEAPGDHDSMVLEPNVRVLAAHIRRVLEDSEWGRRRPIAAE